MVTGVAGAKPVEAGTVLATTDVLARIFHALLTPDEAFSVRLARHDQVSLAIERTANRPSFWPFLALVANGDTDVGVFVTDVEFLVVLVPDATSAFATVKISHIEIYSATTE